jgi:ribosome production factor 2
MFVKGTHVGEIAAAAMKELVRSEGHSCTQSTQMPSQMALKRPDAISFAKKNPIRPFEDASSLEFFSQKNDASFFILGQSTKKRPNGLTFVRTFDNKVLDMVEVGVEKFVSMAEFQVRYSFNSSLIKLSPITIKILDTQVHTWSQAAPALCFRPFRHSPAPFTT